MAENNKTFMFFSGKDFSAWWISFWMSSALHVAHMGREGKKKTVSSVESWYELETAVVIPLTQPQG